MAKSSTRFVCQHCGYSSTKWLGRCPECGEWNSLVEEAAPSGKPAGAVSSADKPRSIAEVEVDHAPRMKTGIVELDRVLGGGLVPGSLVLLGGDPGIGKSTLFLQALDGLARAGKKVLYVSGEESVQQTALRAGAARRASASALHVLAETQLERILDEADDDAAGGARGRLGADDALGGARVDPGIARPGARGGRAAVDLRQDRRACRWCWSAT